MTLLELWAYNRHSKSSGGYLSNMNNSNVYYSSNNFNTMCDEELISLIKKGNEQALDFLIHRYQELVHMKVGKYFIVGAEKEDIMQEGMIGLFKAIKSFDPEKQNSFKTFANLCIERQLITAIKTSNRQKHIPLNSYLSLNATAYDDDDDSVVLDTFNANIMEDPLDMITKKEYYNSVENAIDKALSNFEKQVLQKYMQGDSYVKIAEDLDAPVKSIDNAIQRIRKKAIKNIGQEDL